VTDWREAYHSLDAGGSPEAAGNVGWEWINAEAREAKQFVSIHRLSIDTSEDSMILYLDHRPYAVATVFRTPFNRSILIRWKAP
jgi:hypothetical protein